MNFLFFKSKIYLNDAQYVDNVFSLNDMINNVTYYSFVETVELNGSDLINIPLINLISPGEIAALIAVVIILAKYIYRNGGKKPEDKKDELVIIKNQDINESVIIEDQDNNEPVIIEDQDNNNESSDVQKKQRFSSEDIFRKDDDFRMKNQSFRKK